MVFKPGTFHGEVPERPEIGPAALEDRVAAALARDGSLDAADVAVFASSAEEVTLTGSVGTRDEMIRAEDVAKSVEGVHAVDNKISITTHTREPQVAVRA
ncbi:BON domain-containing protein [Pararhizobium sp.]|uniref:BON domain-containing protein n=1 Tax=Pararhizobium sp. TaxID=1977563 RepID=UPI002727AC57|nr:BON domain-containing protein [Pararhizobium sp.]MDO9416363.1 BON domain-containing protein [Pararhizobium sp.]